MLVEKPIATSAAQAEEVVSLALKEHLLISAGHTFLHSSSAAHNFTVGDRTKVGDRPKGRDGRCRVRNHVFISMSVTMVNDNSLWRSPYDDTAMRGPVIGNGAVVSMGAILLPGTTIRRGAIVGAGEVATRDAAHPATVLGMPARLIERG